MSKESLNDFNLYKNVYSIVKEEEDLVNSPAEANLLNYFGWFIDSYHDRLEDETEYLADEEQYKKFRSKFVDIYTTTKKKTTSNSKFAIPLFIYLYDSNPLGFNSSKFDAFVKESEKLNFSDLLSMYDAYDMGMDLEEKQAIR